MAVATKPTTGKLVGQVFCLTGSFSVKKHVYHAQIVNLGGCYEEDFRSNVTCVVSANTSKLTGKLLKAKERGLQILSEQELCALLA